MFIKDYCVRAHTKFCWSLYKYKGKLSAIAKKMFIDSEIEKSLSCKKSVFQWTAVMYSKGILKSLKYT